MWRVVDFGKWESKGKTLPQILVSDPDWFFWAVEKDIFVKKGSLASEAQTLNRRAKSIKIPANQAPKDCVQYWFMPDGQFARIDLIQSNQPAHHGSSHEERRGYLNLSAPRSVKNYDKLGGRQILKGFKYYWLDDKAFTKARVEEFFSNQDNFLSP